MWTGNGAAYRWRCGKVVASSRNCTWTVWKWEIWLTEGANNTQELKKGQLPKHMLLIGWWIIFSFFPFLAVEILSLPHPIILSPSTTKKSTYSTTSTQNSQVTIYCFKKKNYMLRTSTLDICAYKLYIFLLLTLTLPLVTHFHFKVSTPSTFTKSGSNHNSSQEMHNYNVAIS